MDNIYATILTKEIIEHTKELFPLCKFEAQTRSLMASRHGIRIPKKLWDEWIQAGKGLHEDNAEARRELNTYELRCLELYFAISDAKAVLTQECLDTIWEQKQSSKNIEHNWRIINRLNKDEKEYDDKPVEHNVSGQVNMSLDLFSAIKAVKAQQAQEQLQFLPKEIRAIEVNDTYKETEKDNNND